jgi:hypothetical protein
VDSIDFRVVLCCSDCGIGQGDVELLRPGRQAG